MFKIIFCDSDINFTQPQHETDSNVAYKPQLFVFTDDFLYKYFCTPANNTSREIKNKYSKPPTNPTFYYVTFVPEVDMCFRKSSLYVRSIREPLQIFLFGFKCMSIFTAEKMFLNSQRSFHTRESFEIQQCNKRKQLT